jgi:hypothetical protein
MHRPRQIGVCARARRISDGLLSCTDRAADPLGLPSVTKHESSSHIPHRLLLPNRRRPPRAMAGARPRSNPAAAECWRRPGRGGTWGGVGAVNPTEVPVVGFQSDDATLHPRIRCARFSEVRRAAVWNTYGSAGTRTTRVSRICRPRVEAHSGWASSTVSIRESKAGGLWQVSITQLDRDCSSPAAPLNRMIGIH